MKKVTRFAAWLALNGAYLAAVWAGGFEGVEWARNLAVFGAWVLLFMHVFVAVILAVAAFVIENGEAEGDLTKIRDMPLRAVPKWPSASFDVGVVLLLAALGWFVTAVVYALSMFAESIGRFALAKVQEKIKEAERESDDLRVVA